MHTAIGHYLPVFAGVLALIYALAHVMAVPAAPVLIVALVGESLIAFQMDHHRIPRVLRELLRAVRTDYKARLREIH
jgi:hypothetical protein